MADDTTTVNRPGLERSEDVDIMGQSGAQLDLTEGSTGLLPKGGGRVRDQAFLTRSRHLLWGLRQPGA